MKITFLGTSADTAFPLPFCQCEVCTQARKLGGKNIRKRSSILINDDFLIDMGPDVVSSSLKHNELNKKTKKYGYHIAYDGLVITL